MLHTDISALSLSLDVLFFMTNSMARPTVVLSLSTNFDISREALVQMQTTLGCTCFRKDPCPGCICVTCLLIWGFIISLCPLSLGLIGNLYLNNKPLKNFKIYSLDMTKQFFQR